VTATKWTTAANAVFLQYSGVVWVLLFAPVVLGERFVWRDAAAIAAAFVGMALFFVGHYGAWSRAGDAVALVSGMFYAGLVLSLRRQAGPVAQAAVAWGSVLAALVLLPAVATAPLPSARALAILAGLGVFQIAAAQILFVYGLEHVPATRAALITMLEPVANPVWVFLALGEAPSSFALAGGGIVLAAIGWRTATAHSPVTAVPVPE
jgi:drug/metabolite transporter (DMT)-like permease